MKSFSPEEELIHHRSEERLPEAEEALYEILVPENEGRAIKIESFADLYGEDVVTKDRKHLEDLEAKFTYDRGSKFGKLFEATVNFEIDDADLMGGNASTIVPSRFDDVVNGIDTIIEFEDEQSASHLALAIDVTKSSKELGKKFDRIRDSIKKGSLSRAKYFQSKSRHLKNFRGELSGVPRVVVGADHKTVEGISNLIIRFLRMQSAIKENRASKNESPIAQSLPAEFAKVRHELSTHPMQRMMLLEIRKQLSRFSSYARDNGQVKVAESHEKLLTVIDSVIHEKEGMGQVMDERDLSKDEVYTMIMEKVESFV